MFCKSGLSNLTRRMIVGVALMALCSLGAPKQAMGQLPPDFAPPQVNLPVTIDRLPRTDVLDDVGMDIVPSPIQVAPTCAASSLCFLPRCEFLPLCPLLWQPPLASLRQPRMFVLSDSLDNDSTRSTIDTAIGGTVGLFRVRPYRTPGLEFEVDFFGVHFSRWSERHLAVAGDYRFGFPVTFRYGPWQGKLGYEHTSTHLGDDFIKTSGQYKVQYVRDEVVMGLAYRWWNQLRLYGEFGYAAYLGSPYERGPERFSWGVEWSRQEPTGWRGQPFVAFDMDLRPELNYDPNMSLQIGWQWIPDNQRISARLALELYDGQSPYGQFLLSKEHFYGIGLFIDF